MIDYLELGSYLRSVDGAGWDFYLARHHWSTSAICTKTPSMHNRNILSSVLVASIFGTGVFIELQYIQRDTDPIPQAPFPSLSCFLTPADL